MTQAIVQFPLSRIKAHAPGHSTVQAEIIIFPGVRIERLTDEAPKAQPVRRSRSKTSRQMRTLFSQILES